MSKFIIIQIKEERCAEPDISVGYNISKSDVDIKCSYDDISHKELNVSELKKLKERIINGKNDNFESTKFGLCSTIDAVIARIESEIKPKVQKDDDIDLKKVQVDYSSNYKLLSNGVFCSGYFAQTLFPDIFDLKINRNSSYAFNSETGYSYEIKQHDKIKSLYNDALFNRFMDKCVQLTGEDEETLIEMFAEFMTLMSDHENRSIDTRSHSQGWERLKDLNDLKFDMCEDIGEELRKSSKSFSEFLQKLRKEIQNISKQDEQTFKNKHVENFQLTCIISSLSLEDRDKLLDCFVRSYLYRE